MLVTNDTLLEIICIHDFLKSEWVRIFVDAINESQLILIEINCCQRRGWSGGAMALGKLPVPGRPTIWITVGQGPTALAVGVGRGCLDIFTLIYPFSPLSPSLWEMARYRLKYCLKGQFNPKPNQTKSCQRHRVETLFSEKISFSCDKEEVAKSVGKSKYTDSHRQLNI